MSAIRITIVGGSAISLMLALLAACGGGGGSGGSAHYTIGGSVSGLTGSGLVLQNAGNAPITVSANGNFTFSGAVNNGASYAVTVGTQPTSPSQICTVANGSGTVALASLRTVGISLQATANRPFRHSPSTRRPEHSCR